MLDKSGKLRIAMFSIHSCPMGELGTENTGGMNVYVRELATELGNRGHWVDIYTRFHGDGHKQIANVSETVRFVHLPAGEGRRIHKLAIYPHLTGFFNRLDTLRQKEHLRYDLVHSHYWLSGRVGNWAQDSWRVPHIVMFHTLGRVKNETGVGEKEPELRIITENQLIKSCDRIIATTERGKRELIRAYGAQSEIIGVVPCGVNLKLFRPLDKYNMRNQLGLDPDETILLYVGRFTALKGLDRLLTAMTFLKNNRKIRLVIVGGDGLGTPESIRLQHSSKALGLDEKITFVGRIEHEDLPPYYSAADLLVVPSHHESFGLVALESLACGTPVIATKVGAMEMIIQESKTGCIVDDATPYRLAEKLKATLLDLQHNFASTQAVRNTVVRFGWSNVANAMMTEYRAVLTNYRLSGVEDTASVRY